ncbi:BrnT family toxin [Pseudomonas sp. RIT623]|uniref:BrnT family toxin n=1 Tax=Pseudomonas sp. RIT623 TaxID=2559075 RepID=UPI003558D336
MYVCKYDGSIRFEWDEQKNLINIRKHGVDFDDVTLMFRQPMLVLRDERFAYEEPCWISMGWINAWVCVVAYTERQGDVIRVISARRAARREEQRYVETIRNP